MTIRNLVAVLCVVAFYVHVSIWRAAAENPAPESSSSTQTLTDEQISKLSRLAALHGPDAKIDKRATVALGLTKGDERLALNQVAMEFENGDVHAFYVLPNDGGYLLAFVPEHDGKQDSRYWYHVDKKFRLLGGVLVKVGEGTSIINAPEAKNGQC